MTPTECDFVNEACRVAGMQFVVDPSTLVIGLLSICQLCRRAPIVRYLPSDDPLGNALYVDIEETETRTETQLQSVLSNDADPSSFDWQIVDVRGNAEPPTASVVHVNSSQQASSKVSFALHLQRVQRSSTVARTSTAEFRMYVSIKLFKFFTNTRWYAYSEMRVEYLW